MKHIELKGQVREAGNKAAVKAVRRAGLVPCNIYGLGVENVLFTIDAQDLKLITHTPNSYIVDLELNNGKKMYAVLHEVQYHPVSDEALHVDFLAVSEEKPVTIEVPVKVVGHSEGVKMGGKLLVSSRKLRVSAMMNNLPDVLEVDSTHLMIGKQIVAGDLNFEGVTIVSPKATIICSVRPTRATQQAKMEAQAAGKGKK
jgi:large subunit ribosomal protein L25